VSGSIRNNDVEINTMNATLATPSSRLKALDKLVGTWDLKHRDLNTTEEWDGKDKFEWLPGGHFMAFHHQEDKRLEGVMIIGHEMGWKETEPSKEIVGHYFESTSGYHYKYIWEVDDRTVQFWFSDKQSNIAFKGAFSEDGNTITGTWKWPGGGYDLVMKRTKLSK
jgi:hypothetical protein